MFFMNNLVFQITQIIQIWFLQTITNLKLPGRRHITHVLVSGEARFGLTLSIVNPLGKFGIGSLFGSIGDVAREFSLLGGVTARSAFALFFADNLVFGGEQFDRR